MSFNTCAPTNMSSRHWRRLVKNIGWANPKHKQNIEGKRW